MTTAAAPRHRVLLVREWDQQVGGSGCCGRLNTSSVASLRDSAPSPYAAAREDMQRAGAIYRTLRDRLDPAMVEVTVVDPRNTVWLLPVIWRDGRRRGLPISSRFRQLNRATAPCAVVCDGLVVASDVPPDEAVQAVQADLRGRL